MAGHPAYLADERTGISRNVAVNFFREREQTEVNHRISLRIVIARGAKRTVAIQLDCFVVLPSGTPANERIRFVIASPAWRARQSS